MVATANAASSSGRAHRARPGGSAAARRTGGDGGGHRGPSPGGQRVPPAVRGGLAEHRLDAQQLVVLGDSVGAGRRAGLDLAAVGGDGEVGDGDVLGLARAVRHDRRVGVAGGELDGVEGLGERADLVDLDEDRVGRAGVDAAGEPLGVGDEEVVADELDLDRRAPRSARPRRPSPPRRGRPRSRRSGTCRPGRPGRRPSPSRDSDRPSPSRW